MSNENLTRRDLLKLGAAAAAAGTIAVGDVTPSFAGGPAKQPLSRPLRVAHLTDMHVQPERRAAEGTIACLRHVQQQKPTVDLIVTGGDLIMDAFEADRARTSLQWDLFTKIFRDVPILGVSAINELQSKLKEDKPREFNLRGSRLMTDGRKLRELFREHPNVKLCLSGHIHHLDRVEFKGVTYIGDGAVSGAWWKGPNDYCPEGYGVVDLHADGTWSHKYENYGWKADPSAALERGAG